MQLFAWIYPVLIVVGFLLNAITILTFIKNRKLLTASDLPLLSIAIADCFLSVFVIPFGAAANARDTWPFGSVGCSWYACLNTIVGLGTMLHHTVIAVEKYLKTHRPMTAHVTHKKMLIVIALIWGFASLWGIFPLIGWSSYGPEGTGATCSIKWQSDEFVDASFIISTFVIFFISPSVVIVVSYTTIYNDLQQMSERAKRQCGKEAQQTTGIMLAVKKVTLTAFILIVSFFVVWTPYAFMSFYSAFGKPKNLPPLATTIPAMFAKSCVLFNPTVYFFITRDLEKRSRSFSSAREAAASHRFTEM